MIFSLTTTPKDFKNVLMGQRWKQATWPKRGGWRWSKIEEYKEESDANLNRHALRPNKNIGIWCKPQLTCFETKQKYWNTCPRKLKFIFLIENPDPTFIIETRTKGISITPWPSDYNWITNQRYKVWTLQGRIPDKFIVLEEPKEEQSPTFSNFYSIILYYNKCVLLIRHD